MKFIWLTWKDDSHPEAGGAEVVARELVRRLITEGHSVTMLTSAYAQALPQETKEGLEVIRVGSNRYTHPLQALMYYVRHMRNKYDVLIEEVNAAPYFSVLFERAAKKYLFYHQLEGPVWQYETKKPLSYIGQHILEPTASRILSLSKTPILTISDSTAQDLARYGFRPSRTHIISEGIEIEPLQSLDQVVKFDRPTLLSFGAMRAMKRTLDQIIAFEVLKAFIPDAQLKVAGKADGVYGRMVLARIEASVYRDDIEYLGRVSKEQKVYVMQRSHLIMQTAVHEGWGLTVTEAASQGTPAAVYNVNGLRDSVQDGVTGVVTRSFPSELAWRMVGLLKDETLYYKLRQAAWEWSKKITFDQSYQDFKQTIGVGL